MAVYLEVLKVEVENKAIAATGSTTDEFAGTDTDGIWMPQRFEVPAIFEGIFP